MTRLPLLAVLVAGLAAPVAARDATWLIAPSALVEVARGLGGPAARVETREEEEAVTAYCQGLGAQTADALLLTRRLLDRERTSCEAEAIAGEPERLLGLVGLALDGPFDGLTRRHLWQAFARQISEDGKLADNRARSWREVDPALPDRPIALRIEAPEPLIEALVLAPGCLGAPGYAKLDRTRICRGLRSDLPAGPDPVFIRPLGPEGRGGPIEGISPTAADLASGRYPLARRAYLYLKRPHLPGIPGLSSLLRQDAPGLLLAP